MKNLFSRITLFELVNIKSRLIVEVNVQTKPNSELINTAVLGVISSSIGGMVDLISAGGARQKVLLDFKKFIKLYAEVIIPSISDDGNISGTVHKNNFVVSYGSCNNIARVFPKLSEIPGMEYTNIEIVANANYTKGGSAVNRIVEIIGEKQ